MSIPRSSQIVLESLDAYRTSLRRKIARETNVLIKEILSNEIDKITETIDDIKKEERGA